MTKRFYKKQILAILLVFAMIAMCFSSCNVQGGENNATGSGTGSESQTSSDDSTTTGSEDSTLEQGQIGVGTPEYSEGKKYDPPQNPDISLLELSKTTTDNGLLGCTSIKVLSKYMTGVDYDIYSKKDSTNKIFYLFLPCRADLSSVTFMVTHRNGFGSGPYTADFSDGIVSENEQTIGGASVYSIVVMQSDLPSVMVQIDERYVTVDQMNGDPNHDTFAYGDMVTTVTDSMAMEKGWLTRYETIDENPNKHCSLDMRGRGNATWGYPKRPYQLRFETDLNLLGMGHSDTYILLANYNDLTGMRSQLAMEIGFGLGVDYTSAYHQVDFFLNGEYKGMYMLIEKVQVGPNRVEIDEELDVLYEMDQYYLDQGIYGFATTDTPQQDLRRFRIHSPEIEEKVPRSKQIIYDAEAALYGGNEEEFIEHYDLKSWAKSYLLNAYTMNSDSFFGSFYFYYDHTDGKLHTCAPWDFDWSFGISWGGPDMKDPNIYDPIHTQNVWMKPMIQYEAFQRAILEVYFEEGGREFFATMPDMILRLAEENRLSAEMNQIGAAALYYPGTVTNYDQAVEYLYSIADARLNWLHSRMTTMARNVGYRPRSS